MTGRPASGPPWTAGPWKAASDQGRPPHSPWDQAGPGGPDQPPRSGRERPHRFLARWMTGPGSPLPLRREREGRLAGGIMAGISAKTGIDVTVLRVGLVVVTLLTTGFAAAIYVITWLLLPMTGESSSIASRALADKKGIALGVALGSALGILMIAVSTLGAAWLNAPAWPIIISVCGLVLIARNGAPEEQDQLRRLVEPVLGAAGSPAADRKMLRWLLTAALLIGGLVILLHGKERLDLLVPLSGLLLMLAGIAVALGPWWLSIARDLVAERQARIRAEERADMASRVHDSVLQTLALIQRRANDPQQVIQLARAQERELRSWLFEGRAPGDTTDDATLAAALRRVQQDVEDRYSVP